MEFFKTIVDLCKGLAWPVVVIILVMLFRKEFHDLLQRVKKAEFPGGSLELFNKLREQTQPSALPARENDEPKPFVPTMEGTPPEIEMIVSSGAYSTDYHAIFLAIGLTNRTAKADQVVGWTLTFPSSGIELKPSSPPGNLIGPAPWWDLPRVPPDEFIRGTLFYKDQGQILEALSQEEPLQAELHAETLHGKHLWARVPVSRIITLQKQIQ